MKLFFIISSFIVLANALTYVPSTLRVRRDVAELVAEPENAYLSPPSNDVVDIPAESITEIPNEQSASQESAVLGENGYEYKTVRKLSLRRRRDVSHLKLHYLPPTNEYLPPVVVKEAQISTEQPQGAVDHHVEATSVEELDVITTEQPQPTNEYLPPVNVKEAEISTEEPQPSNEYLPPANVKDSEIIEEISQPSNEYLPPAKLEEFSEAPESEVEPSAKTIEDIEPATEAPEITTEAALSETEIESELPEDSAVLLSDGYHYKKPADLPNLLPETAAPSGLFLPPLDEAIVEGPLNGESAVLAEDGYHYRAIKRRF